MSVNSGDSLLQVVMALLKQVRRRASDVWRDDKERARAACAAVVHSALVEPARRDGKLQSARSKRNLPTNQAALVVWAGADALLAVMSAALLASARGSVCAVLPPTFFVGASPNFERTAREPRCSPLHMLWVLTQFVPLHTTRSLKHSRRCLHYPQCRQVTRSLRTRSHFCTGPPPQHPHYCGGWSTLQQQWCPRATRQGTICTPTMSSSSI